jgi:hypothetical protein
MHQLAIRVFRLTPLRGDPAPGASWMRKPLLEPLNGAAARAAVDALCESGRPVYLSEDLDAYVPLLQELELELREHYALRQVAAQPFALYRIECPSTAGPASNPPAA